MGLAVRMCSCSWVERQQNPTLSSLSDRLSDILRRCTRCHPAPLLSAIAAILSNINTEIATLEQRYDENHDLKQAIMQALPTGKIRLKIEA
jgi:hypothetical protein